jgi:hypothetical protein
VHDAAPVRGGERRGHLRADAQHLGDRQLAFSHALPQVDPFDQLGGEERPAVGLADVVDGDDVRVVERQHRLRLARGSAPAARVGGDVGGSSFNATGRLSLTSRAT